MTNRRPAARRGMPRMEGHGAVSRLSELEISDTLDALSTGVAVLSPELVVLALNPSLADLLGTEREKARGCAFTELLPEGEAAPEAEMILATSRDGVPRSCCSMMRDFMLEIRVERVPPGLLVIEVDDATVHARLERRYDRLLESITDGLCVLDSRWRLTYWNGAAERMTGVKASEVLGRNVASVFGNIVGSQMASSFIETLRRNSPTEIHSWSYAGDDRGRAAGIYDATIYPVDSGGAVVIFREVSQRVRSDRELAERRDEAETLHSLVRSIAEVNDSAELRRLVAKAAMEHCAARGSTVIEVEGDYGVITAAWGESLQLVGTRIPLPGSLTERVMLARESAAAESQPVSEIVDIGDYASEYPEHQRRLLGQVMGPVLATALVAHGTNLAVLMVSRAPGAEPFTRRERERLRVLADHAALGLWKLRLLDQAHAASRAKSDFMATMSHELRTPLAALTGYGEILAEQVAGPLSEDQLDVVERMRSVTNHLALLIDEILTYSSLDAGHETALFTDVVLSEIVSEAAAVVEPVAKNKDISFHYDTSAVTRMVTDPGKLRQILVHILGNAVKFTESGTVKLSTARENGWIKLRVADTGIGIAREDGFRLFQPFSQLDAGLRRRHRGAGLGLFISRRLVELIGGRIDYSSIVGEGTEFTISLPEEPPRGNGLRLP